MNRWNIKTVTAPRNCRGMNLVELMIAMTIGIFLVAGAFSVYLSGKQQFNANETLARLQDDARFAIAIIRDDVRQAGFWGLNNNAQAIDGRLGGTTQLPAITPATNDCGNRWYVDLDNFVSASNGNNPYDGNCLPNANYMGNTDILVVRHTDPTVITACVGTNVGKVFIRSTSSGGELGKDCNNPPIVAGNFEDRWLLTHAYYVRNNGAGTVPSLQRITLEDGGADPIVDANDIDNEIIPGVEELQVQFGVDTNGDDAIDMYVDPGHANAVIGNIHAVRIWLLLRSENEAIDHVDTNVYTMGSRIYDPNPDDGYRRFLATSTIRLRNANR